MQELHRSSNVECGDLATRHVKTVKLVQVLEESAVRHPFGDDAERRLVSRPDQFEQSRMRGRRKSGDLALKNLKPRTVHVLDFELLDRNFRPSEIAAAVIDDRRDTKADLPDLCEVRAVDSPRLVIDGDRRKEMDREIVRIGLQMAIDRRKARLYQTQKPWHDVLGSNGLSERCLDRAHGIGPIPGCRGRLWDV
jgi:hypothetical protein